MLLHICKWHVPLNTGKEKLLWSTLKQKFHEHKVWGQWPASIMHGSASSITISYTQWYINLQNHEAHKSRKPCRHAMCKWISHWPQSVRSHKVLYRKRIMKCTTSRKPCQHGMCIRLSHWPQSARSHKILYHKKNSWWKWHSVERNQPVLLDVTAVMKKYFSNIMVSWWES